MLTTKKNNWTDLPSISYRQQKKRNTHEDSINLNIPEIVQQQLYGVWNPGKLHITNNPLRPEESALQCST